VGGSLGNQPVRPLLVRAALTLVLPFKHKVLLCLHMGMGFHLKSFSYLKDDRQGLPFFIAPQYLHQGTRRIAQGFLPLYPLIIERQFFRGVPPYLPLWRSIEKLLATPNGVDTERNYPVSQRTVTSPLARYFRLPYSMLTYVPMSQTNATCDNRIAR